MLGFKRKEKTVEQDNTIVAKVSVDGTTTEFTQLGIEELYKERNRLFKQNEEVRQANWDVRNNLQRIRDEVFEFFDSRMSTSDDDVTVDRDEINELLQSIGADTLKKSWTATVSIEVTVSGVIARDESEVEELIADEINIDSHGTWQVDGYDVNVYSVELE